MAFEFHPILEAGESVRPGQWYVVSPEGSTAPCQRVGACANYVKASDGEGGKVLVSAGASPEGLLSDVHQLIITKDTLQWSKVHDEDIPARYEHASFTTSTGDLFVFAGAQTTGPLNDVWKYQFSSRTWTAVKGKGSIPPPRTYHTSTSHWSKDSGCCQLLVFSGGAVGTSPVKDRKIYKFDPASGEWTTPATTGTPPTPRQGHIVAVVGSRLFVHGGMAGQNILNDWHCLNLEKWVWSHPKVKGAPSPSLAAHGCAVLDKRLYFFGGLSPSGAASDKLYALDTDSLTLEDVHISGPPPPARLDLAMCSIQLPTTVSACCEKESKTKASSIDTTGVCQDRERDSASATTQLGPNTVTVISPDDTEHKDFSVVADSKSTDAESVVVLSINHSSGEEKTNNLADGGSGSDLGSSQPPTSESNTDTSAADQATVREGDCVQGLDQLSLSSGCESQRASASTTGSRTVDSASATVMVPALFVFGGMDTQDTVHGDAFVFVPH